MEKIEAVELRTYFPFSDCSMVTAHDDSFSEIILFSLSLSFVFLSFIVFISTSVQVQRNATFQTRTRKNFP